MFLRALDNVTKMAENKTIKNTGNSQSINNCSPTKCVINEKSNIKSILVCRKCKRHVHYQCSELPDYQIHLCLSFKLRSFQCRNCVKISPAVLKNLVNDGPTKVEKLKRDVRLCENILRSQGDEIIKLKAENSKQNKDSEIKKLKDSIEQRLNGMEKKIDFTMDKIKNKKGSYADIAKKNLDQVVETIKIYAYRKSKKKEKLNQ